MPSLWPSARVSFAGVTTQLKTARQWRDLHYFLYTWDPRSWRHFGARGLHSMSGQFPHLLRAALPVCHPGLSIYQVARHSLNYQKAEESILENRARTPRQSHWHAPCTDTKPLPPPHTLQHTTHPAPAVSSHPHASPGLRVLWTPHTSVSANLCSLSLHTPLTKACQDVSTGTYIVPNSMFSFRN